MIRLNSDEFAFDWLNMGEREFLNQSRRGIWNNYGNHELLPLKQSHSVNLTVIVIFLIEENSPEKELHSVD